MKHQLFARIHSVRGDSGLKKYTKLATIEINNKTRLVYILVVAL